MLTQKELLKLNCRKIKGMTNKSIQIEISDMENAAPAGEKIFFV